GSNTIDYAQKSQVMGVGNTLKGEDGNISKFNFIDGYKNFAEKVTNVSVLGSNNTVSEAESTQIIGDKRKVTTKDSVVIGSAKKETELTVNNATILGYNANVTTEGGVALGYGSIASTDKGVKGYDPATGTETTESGEAWVSTAAAVSIGSSGDTKVTRQITNVAAGKEDTDAVNVAQLKKVAANDTTIKADTNALSYDKEKGTLSMTVEDTKGNIATGSVPISDIKAAVDTNTKYTIAAGETTGEKGKKTQTTTITLTGDDNSTSSVEVKNDTLVKGDNGLSLNGNTLSMSVKDTAGNEVTGSVDLSGLKVTDTNTTYDMTAEAKGEKGTSTQTTTVTFTDKTDDSKSKTFTVDNDTLKNNDKGLTLNGTTLTMDVEDTAGNEVTGSVDLSDLADGKVASGDTGLVTGDTIYNETRPADGNYVKNGNTTAENLSAIDTQVKTNTDDISNINQTVNNMGGRINKLGTRINKVGAGAAALAALHPQDFDPDDKWDVAAGYGNYKDANAAAVGAFYHPNEDTMISVGGSFGGGENMVNAGVSVKLGQGNHVTTSRVAMAREILDMKQKMEKLEAQNQYLMKRLGAAPEGALKDVNFPDVPKDHWAYQYVKTLADKGYIEGYPDGEFKGDRAMTRYEYAAVIYRALQNGAPVDDKMAKVLDEFEPELDHIQKAARFRVDRISGKDEDRGKVERVRVNNDQEERDVYGGKIPAALKK
ncbi:S-layer homology domain-containing protein, partial [Dialister sp.]|uniref:S-layer homology domain-containing protein n=1 Tax=Dialister sp. TaxID=1955814 RepID=UPI002E820DC1